MKTLNINGKIYTASETPTEGKVHTFLEVGKHYAFRTVTMIYVGTLVAVSETEFVLEDAAWIPETARWSSFVKDGEVSECEPYTKAVVISRGAMLDVTEIPKKRWALK